MKFNLRCTNSYCITFIALTVLDHDLLNEVEPAVVNVVLGEGGHRLWSLPQCQVAIVGLTDHEVVQLLWRGVMILNLDV